MKPSGSASAKNRRSSWLSVDPRRPKMTARGVRSDTLTARPDDEAGHASTGQRLANRARLRLARDRAGAKPIKGAPVIETDAGDRRSQRPEQVGILAPEPLPRAFRIFDGSTGEQLQLEATTACRPLRQCRRR